MAWKPLITSLIMAALSAPAARAGFVSVGVTSVGTLTAYPLGGEIYYSVQNNTAEIANNGPDYYRSSGAATFALGRLVPAGQVVTSATLRFGILGTSAPVGYALRETVDYSLAGFAAVGSGRVTEADFAAPTTTIGSGTIRQYMHWAETPIQVLDVTAFVRSALAEGTSNLGFRFEAATIGQMTMTRLGPTPFDRTMILSLEFGPAATVPEPGSAALLALAAFAGAAALRRRAT